MKTTQPNSTGENVRLFVTPAGSGQAFLTASVVSPCSAAAAAEEAYARIAAWLAEQQMEIVHERAFGGLAAHGPLLAARSAALRAKSLDADTPLTYIQGCPLWGDEKGLAGINLQTIRQSGEASVRTVRDEAGAAVGRAWQRDGGNYLLVQNLQGPAGASRPQQADAMFQRADQILSSQGVKYKSVARTWIYMSKILDWYNDFNPVRTRWYGQFGLMPAAAAGGNGATIMLPASTGIEGDFPSGAAVAMDLLAVCGGAVEQMTNRRQKDAFKYGSSFSRGACIRQSDNTQVLVSGTAAIDEQGRSILLGDTRGQIGATFDIVGDLIAQHGATLRNMCDASIFIKRKQDAEVYREVAAERGLADLPAVAVVADVCRDDLLFEMDGRAVVAG